MVPDAKDSSNLVLVRVSANVFKHQEEKQVGRKGLPTLNLYFWVVLVNWEARL